MRTLWVAAAILTTPSLAVADDSYIELGGFFGPRVFSSEALLGWNENQPLHPDLRTGMGIGARVARPFLKPWLFPELELVVVPTKTTTEANIDTTVVWLEPRIHAHRSAAAERSSIRRRRCRRPDRYPARMTVNSGIVGEGYRRRRALDSTRLHHPLRHTRLGVAVGLPQGL
jgi:hypothetical protein